MSRLRLFSSACTHIRPSKIALPRHSRSRNGNGQVPLRPVIFHRALSAQTGTASAARSGSGAAASTLEPSDDLSEAERSVFTKIRDALGPSSLEVRDISGGCGSMYALDIVSERFAGLSVVKQHRLVNEVLGEEIKRWHGVQLKTRAP